MKNIILKILNESIVKSLTIERDVILSTDFDVIAEKITNELQIKKEIYYISFREENHKPRMSDTSFTSIKKASEWLENKGYELSDGEWILPVMCNGCKTYDKWALIIGNYIN